MASTNGGARPQQLPPSTIRHEMTNRATKHVKGHHQLTRITSSRVPVLPGFTL